MARKLDDLQQAELTAFVNALYKMAGYESTAEWSRDADYPAPNLSRLRNGKGAVDGYNLLKLVAAAAKRAGSTLERLAANAATAGQSDETDHRLATLEGRVAQLVTRDDLVEATERLRTGLLESLAKPGTPETQRPKAARRKGSAN